MLTKEIKIKTESIEIESSNKRISKNGVAVVIVVTHDFGTSANAFKHDHRVHYSSIHCVYIEYGAYDIRAVYIWQAKT